MPTQLIPGKDDHAAMMACIGHVCVQWSLLENNLLGILSAAQGIDMTEAAILFGGLDMKPRLNMAMLLARHHKWKPPLQKRLKALRQFIQDEDLANHRNLLVHGVHKASPTPQHFMLYTPRRSGPAQETDMSILRAYEIGHTIGKAANEAWSIFDDYGRWKFGDHRPETKPSQTDDSKPSIFARIKQRISAR